MRPGGASNSEPNRPEQARERDFRLSTEKGLKAFLNPAKLLGGRFGAPKQYLAPPPPLPNCPIPSRHPPGPSDPPPPGTPPPLLGLSLETDPPPSPGRAFPLPEQKKKNKISETSTKTMVVVVFGPSLINFWSCSTYAV